MKSKDSIYFLDTLKYIDSSKKSITVTIYKKPADRQNYLQVKYSHLCSIEKKYCIHSRPENKIHIPNFRVLKKTFLISILIS